MHDSGELPTTNVLLAFGVNGPARPIAGGQGKTYRAGDLVFKRLYGDDVEVAAEELIWTAGVLNDLPQRDFRAPRYKPSNNGEWTVDGWYAQEWADGANDLSRDRWSQMIQTCRAFHTALADTVRPSFMDQRNDPWARADRIAWNEMPLVCYPELRPLLDKLVAKLRPVNLACQVIHGDFTGNVLFARNLPPAVIDISPYFRPAEFALAIIIVDALVWRGADPSILDFVKDEKEIDQMLIRAEIRRLMEIDGNHRQRARDNFGEIQTHAKTVEIICQRVTE